MAHRRGVDCGQQKPVILADKREPYRYQSVDVLGCNGRLALLVKQSLRQQVKVEWQCMTFVPRRQGA